MRLTVVLAGLAALPLSANAALIRVEYAGTVHSRTGTAFSLGQAITGELLLDTALLPPDISTQTYDAWYYNSTLSNFVTGYVSPGFVVTVNEELYFENDNAGNGGRDYFTISDTGENIVPTGGPGNYTRTFSRIGLNALDPTGTLLSSLLPEDFAFTTTGAFDVYTFTEQYVNNTRVSFSSSQGVGDLSLLRASPASVPEPETLFLLSSGLLALGFVRRRRSANS